MTVFETVFAQAMKDDKRVKNPAPGVQF